MIRVIWTEQAIEDVIAIREFVARDSPRYADLVVERLLQSVDRLREFPESGRVVPELQDPQVREVLLGSYRIVYRLKKEISEILTVFHGSRLLSEGS